MTKKKDSIVLVFLILLFFTINYSFFDSLLINFLDETETVVVERVIDGDTIVIENTDSLCSQHENLSRGKTSVRLLGINSPERGEFYYGEAKDFVEDLVLGKDTRLEFGKEKYDKYNRVLAYVFVGNKNVNLELVEKGLANFYFPSGKDMCYEDFKEAWEKCSENLCEKSKDKCVNCIELKKFEYKKDFVIFYNRCNFDCDLTGWGIKDEGRKNFIFNEFILRGKKEIIIKVGDGEDDETTLFWKGEKYVWTDSGDTLFLRDSKYKLVLWENY